MWRYKRIENKNWTCLSCNSDDIENEFHFMMESPEYRTLRKEYLYSILCIVLEVNDEHSYLCRTSQTHIVILLLTLLHLFKNL